MNINLQFKELRRLGAGNITGIKNTQTNDKQQQGFMA